MCFVCDEIELDESVDFLDTSDCIDVTSEKLEKYLERYPNQIKYLNCCYCPSLTYIPRYEGLLRLKCSNCPKLVKIPNIDGIQEIIAHNLENLEILPNTDDVPRHQFYNCRIIEEKNYEEVKEYLSKEKKEDRVYLPVSIDWVKDIKLIPCKKISTEVKHPL